MYFLLQIVAVLDGILAFVQDINLLICQPKLTVNYCKINNVSVTELLQLTIIEHLQLIVANNTVFFL